MNLWTTHTLRMPAILGVALLLTLATGANHLAHAGHTPGGTQVGRRGRRPCGFEGHGSDSTRPKVEAFFTSESYPRGGKAHLVIADQPRAVSVRIFHAGAESTWTTANDQMFGLPVTPPRTIGRVNGKRAVNIRLGSWPSGVYYAEVKAAGGAHRLRAVRPGPRHWGEHKVAIVLPTQTWQAYNYRDDDGDGRPTRGTAAAAGRRRSTGRSRTAASRRTSRTTPRRPALARRRRDATSTTSPTATSTRSRRRPAAPRVRAADLRGPSRVRDRPRVRRRHALPQRGGNLMFLCANNFYRRVTFATA